MSFEEQKIFLLFVPFHFLPIGFLWRKYGIERSTEQNHTEPIVKVFWSSAFDKRCREKTCVECFWQCVDRARLIGYQWPRRNRQGAMDYRYLLPSQILYSSTPSIFTLWRWYLSQLIAQLLYLRLIYIQRSLGHLECVQWIYCRWFWSLEHLHLGPIFLFLGFFQNMKIIIMAIYIFIWYQKWTWMNCKYQCNRRIFIFLENLSLNFILVFWNKKKQIN